MNFCFSFRSLRIYSFYGDRLKKFSEPIQNNVWILSGIFFQIQSISKKLGKIFRGNFLKIQFLSLLFSFGLFAGIGCSGDLIRHTPEPALEQVVFHSESVCYGFHFFCSEGDAKSLNFRGIFKNLSFEKTIFLDYYLSSFEVSFPIGVSLRLDGTWFNLRKVGTEYSDSVKISSSISTEVADKILQAKEIIFSFSSREKITNQIFSRAETAKFQLLLKTLKERLNAQSKLNILNP